MYQRYVRYGDHVHYVHLHAEDNLKVHRSDCFLAFLRLCRLMGRMETDGTDVTRHPITSLTLRLMGRTSPHHILDITSTVVATR